MQLTIAQRKAKMEKLEKELKEHQKLYHDYNEYSYYDLEVDIQNFNKRSEQPDNNKN